MLIIKWIWSMDHQYVRADVLAVCRFVHSDVCCHTAVILEKQLLLPINLWRVIRSFPDSPPSHSEKDSVSMLNFKVAVSCNWPWKRLYFPFLYCEPYCPCKTHFTFKPHLFEFFSPTHIFIKDTLHNLLPISQEEVLCSVATNCDRRV